MKKNINCFCGANIPFDLEEEFDIDEKPDVLDNILDGSFLSFKCPSCEKKHKPEYKILIIWKSRNLKLAVIPELERGEFYLKKKENLPFETVIGFPEMADRLLVIKDGLEPVVIETLKSYLYAKAMENYPNHEINVWYFSKDPSCIEFHIDGIKQGEVAVMKIPMDMYNKTNEEYRKKPKKPSFASLRVRNYLSVQNILRPDELK